MADVLIPEDLTKLSQLYPDVAVRVIRAIQDFTALYKNTPLRVTEGIRSMERQAALYAQGRETPGKIVTWSKPGTSLHHYGLALDVCFKGADPYLEKHPDGNFLWGEYGRFSVAHGLIWGGLWDGRPDRPHVELRYGLTLKDIQGLYAHGGNSSVWARIDQLRGVTIGTGWLKPELQVKKVDPPTLGG